jgi:predicted nuclease of predicted toxin-antitoxin system
MKILLDECLPRKLKRELIGHEVRTVPEMGWSGKKNGPLLDLMEPLFDLFLTIDSGLQYQQKLQGRNISIVVLIASKNTFDQLQPLMAAVLEALQTIRPGDLVSLESEVEDQN